MLLVLKGRNQDRLTILRDSFVLKIKLRRLLDFFAHLSEKSSIFGKAGMDDHQKTLEELLCKHRKEKKELQGFVITLSSIFHINSDYTFCPPWQIFVSFIAITKINLPISSLSHIISFTFFYAHVL